MNPSSIHFSLPSLLPQFAGKEPAANKYGSLKREQIESAVRTILSGGQLSEADKNCFVRFMRMMVHDVRWINNNPQTAQQVMRAATMCYFSQPESTFTQKIRHFVQKDHKILSSCTLPDLKVYLTVQEGDVKKVKTIVHYSGLFLACQSLMFDRMFKGGFEEANRYKASIMHREEGQEAPAFVIETEDPDLFVVYQEILAKGRSEKLATMSPAGKEELVAYCDMTDSIEALLYADESLVLKFGSESSLQKVAEIWSRNGFSASIQEARLINHLTDLNAACFYAFAKGVKFERLQHYALCKLFSSLTLEQAMQGIKAQRVQLGNQVFSGVEVRDACINCFLNRFKDCPVSQLGEKKGVFDKALSGLKALSIKDEDKGKDANREFLQTLQKEVIPQMQRVLFPALRELSNGHLAYLLARLSPEILALDLSGCKITDFSQIGRFLKLQTLNLSSNEDLYSLKHCNDMMCLETLDLSNCPNLQDLSLSNFPNLRSVRLVGCRGLNESSIKGFSHCKRLQKAAVDSHLKPLFERNRISCE